MWKSQRRSILFLACFGQFIFPLFLIIISILSSLISKTEKTMLLFMGISLLIIAAYRTIGYWFKWNHIYCMHQLSNRQKMTPENIQWVQLSFGDVYGVPIGFSVLALIDIIFYFLL